MSDEGSDHSYFQAIEEAFVRLRGAPLLLSPTDWKIASRWHRQGVPLDLVISTLERFFAERRERGGRGKVQSLRYCAPAVERAWDAVRELRSTAERQEAPAIDVTTRLEALAASLPAGLPGRERLAAAIRRLAGDPSEVEDALARLEDEALAAAREGLSTGERDSLAAEADAALARLGDRLRGGEADAARDRLMRRTLRRRLGLPVLSLFSPQAEGADDGAGSGG